MRSSMIIAALAASTFAYPIAKRTANLVTRDDLGHTSNLCLEYGKQGVVHDDTGVYNTQDGLTYDDFLSFFQDCVYQGGPDQMTQGPSNGRGDGWQCDAASSQRQDSAAASSAPSTDASNGQPSNEQPSSQPPSDSQSSEAASSEPSDAQSNAASAEQSSAQPNDANAQSTSSAPASNDAVQTDSQPQASNDAPPSTDSQNSNADVGDASQAQTPAPSNDDANNNNADAQRTTQSNAQQTGGSNAGCSGDILEMDDGTVRKDDDAYTCTGVNQNYMMNEDKVDVGVTSVGMEYDQAY